MCDDCIQQNGPEMAAVRKVVHSLAGTDDIDDDTSMIEAAVKAADRVERLEDRVAELEELVDPDPGATDYEQLTKDQKVARVRKTLVERAAQDASNGREQMKYREVMMLFDGHPSPGHCYDLMERAAELDGFEYGKSGQGRGEKRIAVNLGAVNDETLIHAAKKASGETPA